MGFADSARPSIRHADPERAPGSAILRPPGKVVGTSYVERHRYEACRVLSLRTVAANDWLILSYDPHISPPCCFRSPFRPRQPDNLMKVWCFLISHRPCYVEIAATPQLSPGRTHPLASDTLTCRENTCTGQLSQPQHRHFP